MKRRMGNSVRLLLASRWMPAWLCVLSFLENTVLFIAVEPLFIPILAARREQALFLAAMLLLGSVAGALAMYFVAFWAYEPFIQPALETMGAAARFQDIREDLATQGLIALFLIGILPMPFQLATLAAGALQMPILPFILVATLSRAVRYFGLATIIALIGWRADSFLRRRTAEVAMAGIAIFVLMILIWAVSFYGFGQ